MSSPAGCGQIQERKEGIHRERSGEREQDFAATYDRVGRAQRYRLAGQAVGMSWNLGSENT
jgi:hypothetical protein